MKMVRKGGGFAAPKPELFGGPKKPALGPFFLWSNTVRTAMIAEMREKSAKEGTPFKVTELCAYMALKYKDVGDELKAELKAKSEIVKAKWTEEMEAWKKTPEYQKYLTQKTNTKEKGDLKKARAGVMDAGMPKKPATAFMLFINSRREAITADLKAKNAFKIQDVSIIGSKEWQQLSAEKKAPLEEEAKVLREQYAKDIEAFKQTDAYKEFETQTQKIKAVKVNEKATIKANNKAAAVAVKAAKKVYIVNKPINMTEGLDLASTVIRSIEANEKLETVEEASEEGGNLRVKCVAPKDKVLGFVSIKEGETEYLTIQPEKKPRKPRVTKKKGAEAEGSEAEGDEDTKESGEEQPVKKERKKREPKAKVEGEPTAKKPRAMKTATNAAEKVPTEVVLETKDAPMEEAA